MTDRLNRGSENSARIIPPTDRKERERFWIDRGNRVLWGQEATTKGEYLAPRLDLEWACNNGSYFIQLRK